MLDYKKQFQQLKECPWHYIFLHKMVWVNSDYAFHIVYKHQQSAVLFKTPALLYGIVWMKLTFDLPQQQMTGKIHLRYLQPTTLCRCYRWQTCSYKVTPKQGVSFFKYKSYFYRFNGHLLSAWSIYFCEHRELWFKQR